MARTLHPIGSLPNANPVETSRSGHRLDPFWDGLWAGGSNAAWWSSHGMRRAVQAGSIRRRKSGWTKIVDDPDALGHVFDVRRSRRIGILATASLWRTASAEQAAAMIGADAHTRTWDADIQAVWAAGLVEAGTFVTPNAMKLTGLVRPDPQGNPKRLRDQLTFDEWVGITAGLENWRWGSQFARHNLLTTELCLRVAELCPVRTVLGEPLCQMALHAPPGLQLTKHQANVSGDAMIVRSDGLKIIIEMTATSTDIDAKMRRWSDLLMLDRDRTTAVCFVLAGHPDVPAGTRRKIVKTAIRTAARASIDHVMADVESRMMLADWRDWFPASHQVDLSLLTLEASRATGRGDEPWEPVAMLDPFDLQGPDIRPAILDTADLLWGTPHWLRNPDAPTALERWADTSGVPERYPVADRSHGRHAARPQPVG